MNAVLKEIEYRIAYDGCPLCSSESAMLRTEKPQVRGDMTYALKWMKCTSCEHVHTEEFYSELGYKELFKSVISDGIFGGKLDEQRVTWSGIIERITPHVKHPGKWIDVGVGNGAFLFTASEFGFDAIGIDKREYVLDPLTKFGYSVVHADAETYDYEGASVVILADILEHIPYPKDLLKRIRQKLNGALFVSCPNMDSVSWKYQDKTGENPFWEEAEHFHNFTRARLQSLLIECGFTPVSYCASVRYRACMEIVAI